MLHTNDFLDFFLAKYAPLATRRENHRTEGQSIKVMHDSHSFGGLDGLVMAVAKGNVIDKSNHDRLPNLIERSSRCASSF